MNLRILASLRSAWGTTANQPRQRPLRRSCRTTLGRDGWRGVLRRRATDHATFRRIELGLAARPDPAVQVWSFAEDREAISGSARHADWWASIRRSNIPHGGPTRSRRPTAFARCWWSGRRVWIGHDAGLFSVSPGSRITRHTTEDRVSGGTGRALLQSSDGRVWIAAWEGLTEFDGVGFKAFTRAHGITTPRALAEDRTGNLWIGTLAAGAIRLTRNGFLA